MKNDKNNKKANIDTSILTRNIFYMLLIENKSEI